MKQKTYLVTLNTMEVDGTITKEVEAFSEEEAKVIFLAYLMKSLEVDGPYNEYGELHV